VHTFAVGNEFASSMQIATSEAVCNLSAIESPLNGSDSRAVNVGSEAGTQRGLRWKTLSGGTRLIVLFRTASCKDAGPSVQFPAITMNTQRSIAIPPGTKWLVFISSVGAIGVEITIS